MILIASKRVLTAYSNLATVKLRQGHLIFKTQIVQHNDMLTGTLSQDISNLMGLLTGQGHLVGPEAFGRYKESIHRLRIYSLAKL